MNQQYRKPADGDIPDSPIDNQLAAPPADEPILATVIDGPMQQGPASHKSVLQSRAAVLATLFLVTGVLGVPLLWVNQKFSKGERIFWSIVVTIYTAILISIAYAIVMWSYRQIIGR